MKKTSTSSEIDKKIQSWLDGPYDNQTKEEILKLQKHDPKSLNDAFYQDMAFGTGGMRGVMGVGTNRINIYTIAKATQGLANYIKKQKIANPKVFIGYDVRNNSKLFAQTAAKVLAANDIFVFLSADICPTPLVSFGCRYFKATAAIMITASHNPVQYNGYKVYWSDGGQIVAPHDSGIIKEVNDVENPIWIETDTHPLIQLVDTQLDAAYLKEMQKIKPLNPNKNLNILYSPLHGTGIRIMEKALNTFGFSSIHLVEKQSTVDGNFPFASSPNPEEKKALSLGFSQLQEKNLDIFFATDPDADRVGVACLHDGQVYHFTGNQIACLLIDYICKARQLPANATFVKSIVTSELFAHIATQNKAINIDVLTGFKFIGEKILQFEKNPEKNTFVFGAEESCGYLYQNFVRDKDGIQAACLIAEMAGMAKIENKTLVDKLYEIYQQYGVYQDRLINIGLSDSLEGMQAMQNIMQSFRDNPPKEILGIEVEKVEDFSKKILGLPASDVLRFWLKDKTKIVIRPSGTEPKMKIYLEVFKLSKDSITKTIQHCQDRLVALEKALLALIQK